MNTEFYKQLKTQTDLFNDNHRKYCKLQDVVFSVNKENYKEVFNYIILNHDFRIKNQNVLLIHTILLAARYRSRYSEILALLLSELLNYNDETIQQYKSEVVELLFEELFLPTIIEIWGLFLLHKMHQLKLFSTKELVNRIGQYFYTFGKSFIFSKFQTINIYFWFSEEIKQENASLFEEMNNFIYNLRFKWLLNREYYQFSKIFDKIDIKEHNINRDLGRIPDKLILFIENDDIEAFQKELSDRNLSADFKFPNSNSYYERSELLRMRCYVKPYKNKNYITKIENELNRRGNNNLSLIEASAYFGAVKIFKFLMFNKPSFDHENATRHDIRKMAISGGNAEIIHILEQNNVVFSGECCSWASRFYQNEIFFWLFEKNNLSSTFLTNNSLFSTIKNNYNIMKLIIKQIYKSMNVNVFLHFLNLAIDELCYKLNEKNLESDNEKNEIYYHLIKLFFKYSPSIYDCILYNHLEFIKMLMEFDYYKRCVITHFRRSCAILAASICGNKILFCYISEIFKFNKARLAALDGLLNNCLHISCMNNNKDLVKYILQINDLCKIIINDSNSQNQTPLYIAVEQNNLEIVEMITNNKNYFLCNYYHFIYHFGCSLVSAIRNNRKQIVNYLLEIITKNDKINIEQFIPSIEKSQKAGHKRSECVELAVLAANFGDIEMMNILLKYEGINFNCYNDTPLRIAIEKRNMEMVKLLLESKKVDVDHVCRVFTYFIYIFVLLLTKSLFLLIYGSAMSTAKRLKIDAFVKILRKYNAKLENE